MRRISIVFLAVLAWLVPSMTESAPRRDLAALVTSARRGPRPASTDAFRQFDVNRIGMVVTNYGFIAFDDLNGNPGFVYPRGSGHSLVYAAGLWLGAKVAGHPRVAVAQYASEYRPGSILPGGVFDDPLAQSSRVYKMVRWTGDPADSGHVQHTALQLAADPSLDPVEHDSWSEYLAGAVPHGAPVRTYRLPAPGGGGDSVDVLGPDVSGDQMLWSVYNDANPQFHSDPAGGTDPLDVEVRQTVFGFDRSGPLGDVVLVRYRILNKGPNPLDSLFASLWADPDIGNPNDDLMGCDPGRALAFAYNGRPEDALYGAAPPAIGFVALATPGNGLGAVRRVLQAEDPVTPDETYRAFQGLDRAGDPIVDDLTGHASALPYSGDAVRGTGWIDLGPADRRLIATASPVMLPPGDSLTVLFAIVVGQGADHRGSIAALRCAVDDLEHQYLVGFASPDAPLADCGPGLNCPRPASWWQRELAAPNFLSPAATDALARQVDRASTWFDWGAASPATALRQAMTPPLPTTPRTNATREYAALCANLAAARLDTRDRTGAGLYLDPVTGLVPDAFGAPSVAELAADLDTALANLATLPLAQPSVAARYDSITARLQDLNQGIGVGAVCDVVTPVLASRVEVETAPDQVRLAWQVSDPAFHGTVERAVGSGPWLPLADALPDGTGRITVIDRDVTPGARFGYRLRAAADAPVLDQVWVEVPRVPGLALAIRPNPAPDDATLAFTLPVAGPATIALFDVAGRLVLRRDLGTLAPGRHEFGLEGVRRLAPGVYRVVLSQEGRAAARRLVVVR